MTIVGTTAYVADDNSGLQIIDVSSPAAPTLLGSYDTQIRAFDVIVAGTIAYVADVSFGLIILDVSGGSFPCPADLTGDCQLNFFDVSAFLNAFSSGCP